MTGYCMGNVNVERGQKEGQKVEDGMECCGMPSSEHGMIILLPKLIAAMITSTRQSPLISHHRA